MIILIKQVEDAATDADAAAGGGGGGGGGVSLMVRMR